MLKASQIATMINEIWDGVERSKAGSIFLKDKKGNLWKDDKGAIRLQHVPYQTFLSILNNSFPKQFYTDGKIKVKEE